MQQTRTQLFHATFPTEPKFRIEQMERGLFDVSVKGWEQLTTVPKQMRETLTRDVPFSSVSLFQLFTSKTKDTYKALLQATDKKLFESVLMENRRGQWTICVSSQIGCAMKCTFCATGTMGLKRSLTPDEIVDQYRYWMSFLSEHPELPQRISNVVFMGMGEPLANYESVKTAINTWLKYTDLGPTHITVSTVGILTQLEKILTDPNWPHVRIAVSLHSANQKRREEIVPTTVPDFLVKLADWAVRYDQTLGNRRHHVTYEYTLLCNVNDNPADANELARFILKTGSSKVNVIPYNPVKGKAFTRGDVGRIDAFKEKLRSHGVTVTQRKTMGVDIAAACGQLVVEAAK